MDAKYEKYCCCIDGVTSRSLYAWSMASLSGYTDHDCVRNFQYGCDPGVLLYQYSHIGIMSNEMEGHNNGSRLVERVSLSRLQ